MYTKSRYRKSQPSTLDAKSYTKSPTLNGKNLNHNSNRPLFWGRRRRLGSEAGDCSEADFGKGRAACTFTVEVSGVGLEDYIEVLGDSMRIEFDFQGCRGLPFTARFGAYPIISIVFLVFS